jgi:hypothetical protein
MGPKWVKMRVGRGGRKWGSETEKLRSENTKIGLENHKKWVRKSKKWGGASRVEREGRGRGREKRILNKRK